MNSLLLDLRYALRSLNRNRAFAAAAILSLAIGIGANTAIFSVMSALLLRPLPYQDAARLAILWNRSPGLNITEDWFSTAQYFDIKNSNTVFDQVAIAIGRNENLTGSGEPERVGVIRISASLLPLLGTRPAAGRLFTPEEDHPGRNPVAILSHGIWIRRYGSDPKILGQSIYINGAPYEVVGILPASFSLPREVLPTLGGAEHAEILLPLPLSPAAVTNRGQEDYNILARLKPGVSPAQAQSEMDTLTARLRRDFPAVYPPNGQLTFGVVPLQQQVVGEVRNTLFILLGAVAFVLLIACANVASLLLSRAVARQKEIAVRTAIGASPGRIIRQLLTESVLLALAGGTLGVLFAVWSLDRIHVLGLKSVPRLHEISIDAPVLLFTLLLSILSGILFGLAPALRVSRLDLHSTLNDAGRGSSGMGSVWGRGHNLRRLLVISELALSVILLIGAGLLIRSFTRLQTVAPGFHSRDVLTLGLTLRGRKYADSKIALESYRLLWDRLARIPGVESVGAVSALPLSQMFAWGPIVVEGRAPLPGENFVNADIRIAAADYFETMRIPLRTGRHFTPQDLDSAPRVVLVDAFMASELWPGQNPVGKRIRFGTLTDKEPRPWMEVIGVVGRIKQYTLDADSRIALYVPHNQYPVREINVVLRSSSDPAALAAAVKKEILAVDSDLPMYAVRTMDERVAESLARRRFSMLLLVLFAALSLVLATLGIYSVMAYLVTQSTREIGIRIALGATQKKILRMVVGRGLAVALAGVSLGLVGAFLLTRFLSSLLFGVPPTDPATFLAIALLLFFVALAASYIPARRAARVDPMVSLRWE